MYTSFDIQEQFILNFTIGNQLCSARIDQSNPELCFYLDTYDVSKAIQSNVVSTRTLSTGPGAIVIQEREDLFGLEGVIVRIAVAVDTFYIVEFEGGHYYYFTEDELEVIND